MNYTIVMKIVLAATLTAAVFALLHINPFRKKKGIILSLYALGMILLFVIYNVRTIDKMLPSYQPRQQTFYQSAFFEKGEYPDAFLEEFLKGKTVYTKDDAHPVSDDIDVNKIDKVDDDGYYFLFHYYHAVNMWNYLDLNKAKIVKDASLNDVSLTDAQMSYFEDLGMANDMFRYTFSLTPYYGEWGNAFYHYWYFSTFIGESHIYICPTDIEDADELVVLWQRTHDHDTESFYIASKAYFDEVISK